MSLLDLEMNQKNYIKILVFCIIVVCIILVLYYVSLLTYKTFTLEEGTVVANIGEQDMNVHIDILEHQKGDLAIEIAGWAYKENEKIKNINSNYVLKNTENGQMYLLRTRYEENINVPEEYKISGLHARAIVLGMPEGRYEIYVLYKNNKNDVLANTGIHVDI